MKAFMDAFKVRVGNVRIDLRGGDVTVAEHGLHATQIGSVHQKVGCEGMPQCMRTDVLGNACQQCVMTDQPLHAARRQPVEVSG